MQQEMQHKVERGIREAAIRRIAHQFDVTPADVRARLDMVEQQKRMTQALIRSKKISRP